MNPAQLLEHFNRISEAPDAVARLRRFILDLAVRGKLVEQDPNDEPAAELLKRIQAEKARLVKGSKAKREKPLVTIETDEAPFFVPTSWIWVRLQDITSYLQRGKSPTYATEDGFPVISQKCVQWRGLDLSATRLIAKESIRKYEDVRFLCENDLLWNSTGTGTIGRVVRVDSLLANLVCDSHVTVVRCALVDAEYVRSWLRSDHVYLLIEERAAGSTNQVELTAQMATAQVVPLPPLAEQHRIVAKVDELMALCDQLEAAKSKREKQRDRLVAASLHHVCTALPESLPAAARFHLDNLPRLTTRPEHIKQLRQTILNLAVRGRLVPQDPNDEPAAELLKRIQAEKNSLTPRRKGAKKDATKGQENLGEGLPAGWGAADLSDYALDVCTGPFGSALHQSDYIKGGIPLVNPSHMVNDRIVSDEMVSVPTDIADRLSSYRLEPGDVVMARRGEVGRAALVEPHQKGWLCGTGSFYLRFSQEINRRFFLLLLRSVQFRSYLAGKAVGTTMVNLNHNILNKAWLEIPPLAEQYRIVAKVDELMALCDQLEAQLATSQTDSRRLLEAVLRDALVFH